MIDFLAVYKCNSCNMHYGRLLRTINIDDHFNFLENLVNEIYNFYKNSKKERSTNIHWEEKWMEYFLTTQNLNII